MQIDDLPPDAPRVCATCCEPLTWIWVHHLKRNVAVVPLRDPDRFSFRLHTCALKPERTWRYVQRVDRETTESSRREARLVAVAALKKLADKKET